MTIADTALLLMDFQDEITSNYSTTDIIPKTAAVLAAARKAGLPVFFVVVGFRPGYPEISPSNKSFSALKQSGRLVDAKVIAELQPRASEPVITKRRVSAFAGSDLEVVLRSHGIRHIVLGGIATSGVVLSTTRLAADMDYQITILADCCADNDAEVHRVLLEKILPRQATVITSEEFLATL
ncbi:MAG TPA: isochorismatase family cysteine hydrolase [Devosiaceae bacterium]